MGWHDRGVWDVTDDDGNRLTVEMAKEAARSLGLKHHQAIRTRVDRGKSVEEAMTMRVLGAVRPADKVIFPASFQPFIADFCGGRPHGFPALKLGI